MPADPAKLTPEATLRGLLGRFDVEVHKLARAARSALRKRFPTALELAYDYTSHVVIAYGPTERGSEAVVALDVRAEAVRLYITHGPKLADPTGLLQGTGRQTRFLALESAEQLGRPEVEALIAAAVDLATVPLPAEGKGKLILKPAAAERRPRRKPTKRR